MFNLDQAIADWRRQLAAGAAIGKSELDELESHLRDEIDRQSELGLSPAVAFQAAVDLMGAPSGLRTEFAIDRPRVGARVKFLIFAAIILLAAFVWAPLLSRQSLALLGGAGAAVLALFAYRWRRVIHVILRQRGFVEPDLSLLNPASLQSLASARLEAPKLHHNFVGTEHLLLGLTLSAPESVRALGLDATRIRDEIQSLIGIGQALSTSKTPLTPRARHALSLAIDEARAMKLAAVAPEHIFLGLLREPHGAAAVILRNMGFQLDATRSRIQAHLRKRS